MSREHQIVYSLIAQREALAADLSELRNARNQAGYDLDLPHQEIADRLIDAQRLSDHLMRRLDELRATS